MTYMVFGDLIPYWQSKWTLWVLYKVVEENFKCLLPKILVKS